MEDFLMILTCICFLLGVIILFILIGRFFLYVGQRKSNIKRYTIPLKVKCVEISNKVMKKRQYYNTGSDGAYSRSYNTYVVSVDRPIFSGYYMGKYRSFCRKNDIYQPKAVVGQEYTIYLDPKDSTYRDYREEKELFHFGIRNKAMKGLIIFDVCLLLAGGIALAILLFVFDQIKMF